MTRVNERGRERNKGAAWVPSSLSFPLTSCLLNITSAEVRDRQEVKTIAGKLETRPATFTLCTKQ